MLQGIPGKEEECPEKIGVRRGGRGMAGPEPFVIVV
jgi:hypothetical protein